MLPQLIVTIWFFNATDFELSATTYLFLVNRYFLRSFKFFPLYFFCFFSFCLLSKFSISSFNSSWVFPSDISPFDSSSLSALYFSSASTKSFFVGFLPSFPTTSKSRSEAKLVNSETDNSLNFTNKSVLIIDDDKENLSYLEFVIRNSKAKIYKASNGVEALDIFKEKNTELQIVVMDISMPGLNGNEAAKFMKQINPSVPILLVTAYSFYNNKLLNADKVLIKPFSPKVLIQNISELVN